LLRVIFAIAIYRSGPPSSLLNAILISTIKSLMRYDVYR